MNKCTVKAFEGTVVVVSANNPVYGSVRVEQVRNMFKNGFLQKTKTSAFINGTVEDLKSMDWFDGQPINGHIVIKESLTPFNESNPDKDLKIAGDTNVVCTLERQPIYRRSYFTGQFEEDTLFAHDNGAEIKAVQARLAEEKTIAE